MNKKWFQFGDAVFCLNAEMEIKTVSHLKIFQCPLTLAHYQIDVFFAGPGESTPDDYGRARIIRSGNCFQIHLNPEKYPNPTLWHVFGLLPVEQLLLERRTLILHASYLWHRGQAILFSGPSGIGKSTQADLWARHRAAQIINGDRTLIFEKEGVFYAASHYHCGSSGICKNVTAPIRAVVMLDQGTENQIHKLRGMEVFRRLTEHLICFPEGREQMETAADLAARLASSVTVCGYSCTKDEQAVDRLEGYLYGE